MATHGNKINAGREYYVVKSNEIIQKGRYNLSTTQQKIILYAISKLKKNDDPNKLYEISIDELCRICGFDIDSGGVYYKKLKADMQKLTTPVWVQFPDQSEWTVAWFSNVGIVPLSGTVYVQFHEKVRDHLFALQEKYTQYHLSEVLVYKNKYAIRLFEILRSFFTQEDLDNGIVKDPIIISVKHLREQFCLSAYPAFGEFERNVLKKAVAEINEYAEQMKIRYEKIKSGTRIDKIKFIVESPDFDERVKRYENERRVLKKYNGHDKSKKLDGLPV